jgi:hypothetical protein
MINFKKHYEAGVRAFTSGEKFYDVFSGFEKSNYTGKFWHKGSILERFKDCNGGICVKCVESEVTA